MRRGARLTVAPRCVCCLGYVCGFYPDDPWKDPSERAGGDRQITRGPHAHPPMPAQPGRQTGPATQPNRVGGFSLD